MRKEKKKEANPSTLSWVTTTYIHERQEKETKQKTNKRKNKQTIDTK